MNRLLMRSVAALVAAALPAFPAEAQGAGPPAGADAGGASPAPEVVTITGPRPRSLPAQIPATTASATRQEIERSVNAADAEDALKYFPSLLVRKRYIGDYNHAILSSRASGTGNSARSAVYADGLLLSNYLGNGVGGLSYPPRWGLVTPEEIERVDVLYGPFSAAYPGNSVGAVVDYVTRMPARFEAHAKVGAVVQPFELYGTNETYRAWQASAAVGDRAGDWAWWLHVARTDSRGQPLTFATRLAAGGSAGNAGASATPVSGAVGGVNAMNQPWLILGAGTQYDTRQDHLKFKLAWDVTSRLRASWLLGLWRNAAEGGWESYLRDAAGRSVYAGPVRIDGADYTALSGADFAHTRERLLHAMQGFALESHTGGAWDWKAAAGAYDYRRDDKRQNAAANVLPGAAGGGAGTLAAGGGTGWRNLALKGIWRPDGAGGAHTVEFGWQLDRYRLRYATSEVAGNYLADAPGALVNAVRGETRLESVYAQDAWRWSDRWQAVLGLRAERWRADGGRTDFSATSAQSHPGRSEDHLSPKAALSWQAAPGTVLRAALGRAVRLPTVAELYGATSTTNSQYINDPGLAPERSWTGEAGIERSFAGGSARLTAFAERTRDSLYAQTTFDAAANRNIARVQNVARIATRGVEAAAASTGWPLPALDLSASVTYADSAIKDNAGFVAVPGDTIGRRQPNIPRWRATLLASWRFDEHWTGSVGARWSGHQYRTLDNADVNGHAYMGVSPYATVDLRLLWRLSRQWSAAFGVDNAGNDRYWNFHPYPQRSWSAELKFDL